MRITLADRRRRRRRTDCRSLDRNAVTLRRWKKRLPGGLESGPSTSNQASQVAGQAGTTGNGRQQSAQRFAFNARGLPAAVDLALFKMMRCSVAYLPALKRSS